MSELGHPRVFGESVEQCLKTIHRFRRVTETRGKLKKNAAKFPRFEEWCDSLSEFLDVRLNPTVFFVRELLPRFDRKFEVFGRPLCPALRRFRSARPIESGIDLDCIEVPRIELQFVGSCEWIKQSCPRTWSRVGWIAPAAGSDSQYTCIILGSNEKAACHWLADFSDGRVVCRLRRSLHAGRAIAQNEKPHDDRNNRAACKGQEHHTETDPDVDIVQEYLAKSSKCSADRRRQRLLSTLGIRHRRDQRISKAKLAREAVRPWCQYDHATAGKESLSVDI